MKRATLLSTLVVDELQTAPLRRLLLAIDPALHQNDDTPPRPLASRRLLERATLAAALIEQFHPDFSTLADLILQAEGRKVAADADLHKELSDIHRRIREEFAPLAFLYDLRTHGGLAHPPNLDRAREAAESLGLPSTHWRRADYLRLLELTALGIERAAAHLRRAALAA